MSLSAHSNTALRKASAPATHTHSHEEKRITHTPKNNYTHRVTIKSISNTLPESRRNLTCTQTKSQLYTLKCSAVRASVSNVRYGDISVLILSLHVQVPG